MDAKRHLDVEHLDEIADALRQDFVELMWKVVFGYDEPEKVIPQPLQERTRRHDLDPWWLTKRVQLVKTRK